MIHWQCLRPWRCDAPLPQVWRAALGNGIGAKGEQAATLDPKRMRQN